MSRHRLVVSGSVAPQEVWERYARPDLWSTWSPQIRRVEFPGERITAGGEGTVHGPVRVAVRFVVDAVDERERTWTWTVRLGAAGHGPVLHLDHGVTAAAGGGTTTTLVVDGPAVVVLLYLPVAGLALARLVRRAPAATTPR